MQNNPNTTCAKCGAQFHCSAGEETPCWCKSLPNIMPVENNSCLCPNCLNEAINEKEKVPTDSTASGSSVEASVG